MWINIGFTVMVVLCCLGVASLLFRVPSANRVENFGSRLYVVAGV